MSPPSPHLPHELQGPVRPSLPSPPSLRQGGRALASEQHAEALPVCSGNDVPVTSESLKGRFTDEDRPVLRASGSSALSYAVLAAHARGQRHGLRSKSRPRVSPLRALGPEGRAAPTCTDHLPRPDVGLWPQGNPPAIAPPLHRDPTLTGPSKAVGLWSSPDTADVSFVKQNEKRAALHYQTSAGGPQSTGPLSQWAGVHDTRSVLLSP